MKPKLFIGSSVESLEIAYAIQSSLEYDAEVTVWNQGVFQLSGNTLDDLITVAEEVNFAIFVFNPDDILIQRDATYNAVRDNVVFELGLFVGKLSKHNVFYLVPRTSKDFHLPTDLIGVMPGKFDNTRTDGNLKAAVSSFCNDVRSKLKNFKLVNIKGYENEPLQIRKILVDRSENWKIALLRELIAVKFEEFDIAFYELNNLLKFRANKRLDNFGSFDFILKLTKNYMELLTITERIVIGELTKYFDVSDDEAPPMAKRFSNQIDQLCRDYLDWESELVNVDVPEEFQNIVNLMIGWGTHQILEIKRIVVVIDSLVNNVEYEKLKFTNPENFNKASDAIAELRINLIG